MLGQFFALFAIVFFFAMPLLAFTNRRLFNYMAKITLLYMSIMLSSFFSCFGAFVTYFYNEGSVVAMKSFHFIASFWLDVTVEVRGYEKIKAASGPDQNPLVIISNHQSSLDLYTMSSMWPEKCTAMMKKSLKYVPFFNIGAILSNSIFVDRTNKDNAHEALGEAVGKMRSKKLKIWVFPEGTRHHEHGLLPFKKGAFNIAVCAHFPIVPVVISDYTPFYSKPKRYFNSKGHIIVQVMDPVSTEGLTYEDAVPLCDRIRQQMSEVYETISKEAEQLMAQQSRQRLADKNSN